jgi:hypothetical protein
VILQIGLGICTFSEPVHKTQQVLIVATGEGELHIFPLVRAGENKTAQYLPTHRQVYHNRHAL